MSLVSLEERPGGVRLLRLDDPDRRNAISPRLQDDLCAAVDAVAADLRARTLVITGNGTAFCAGADLVASFGDTGRTVRQVREDLRATYDSFLRVRRLEIPTIAAVQGPAVGAGVNLALSCDVRIAGPQAKFGITFSRLGLHPGGGCTYFLVRALGTQRALSLLLDGATLTAEEAVATGLVREVADDPLAEALAVATRWAALDTGLVADIKRAVALATTGGFEEVLEFEAWAQASSAGSPAVAKAVEARRKAKS
ncbi:enoyl-CoA hydratase [Amycolatopsis sp. K13G38]|uniref:Enoyl-CoA hydratase n=1 Tax=Amycolatopsis acididurans TaxID=2724524 RepID=A0ABX1IW09_9PSEU|nr:enoyl-CoA hydratase [Amycolatopsis acididurans]NKQ51666.1 enoyl-CoA hydratase [Amycolatopsis acididurans]